MILRAFHEGDSVPDGAKYLFTMQPKDSRTPQQTTFYFLVPEAGELKPSIPPVVPYGTGLR